MGSKFLLFLTFSLSFLEAQILSPTAVEKEYSYTATFKPNHEDPRALAWGWTAYDYADEHANHIFGILAAPESIKMIGDDPNQVGGVGAPRFPRMELTILRGNARSNEIEYQVKGRAIIHKDASRRRVVNLPLPYDMTQIYKEECTDPYYTSLGDYWYFYNPFRKGCESLKTEPIAKDVRIELKAVRDHKLDQNPHFNILRGNNGNGKLFSIYMMTGFYMSATNSRDQGRVNDKEARQQLRDMGFEEEAVDTHENYPRYKYTKNIVGPDNKEIEIVVHTQLAETDAASPNVTFAKFFKEAAENADVFLYDGHSGLGSNLDLANLEAKAGKFRFRQGHRQIFFFNSCSSYSYYLDSFAGQKTTATIDVITTGLESDFMMAIKMHRTFIEEIFSFDDTKTWTQVLKKIEDPIPGGKGTYLLNVGGV